MNPVKERLALEVTTLVHGAALAQQAQEAARALFGGGGAATAPIVTLADTDFVDGAIDILALLVKAGLARSKSEARGLVEQGGVTVDDAKVEDFGFCLRKEQLQAAPSLLKKGKKSFKQIQA
jgi:tyrosyl-tRNA synthetase